MIILQGNKIERSFSGDVLFDNINIQVDERDRIALVGRNGAGKSTLLKILVGEEAPTSGEINTKRDLNLSYLAQDSRFESSNTIYAEMLNVFAGLRADEKRLRDMEMKMAELTGSDLDKLMTDYDRLSEDFRQRGGFTYESDIRAILNGFKFDESMWEMTISDLSGGQNTRLALAKMLLEKPELLVLDEPTNHLDIETIAWLENYLVNYQGALIIVSHDRRKQLEKMERLDKPTEGQKSANMTFHADKVSGNVVLTVRDAAIGYDDEILSEPISLDVKKMDAIAIVGPNGIGKTTFIKSVVGQLPFIKGTSTYGANVEIGYYDQTQSALTPSNTVLDELWNDFATTPEVEIRNRLGAFLFSGDDVKKSVSMLSGGERARLLLAKLSMENNNFLILDEPTNHLDIDSKEVLENALIDFDGTLLFVSHDRYFINRVATKVMEISEDGATIYLGDYDYYLEKKAELEELARLEAEENQGQEEVQVASAGANDYQAQKANQKEMRKLSRRIEQIENELETIEERLEEITAAMLETNEVAELSDLQKELDELSVNQEALMEEWSDLSEQLEG